MAKLKDYVIVQPKSKIKASEGLNEGEYKFFTSSNTQSKWVNQYQYDNPALIFGTGGMASVHFCDTPFSTSTDCIVMYAKGNLNLEYVYRYLESHMYILENGFKGVGLKHISKEYILSISIPEADVAQQENVAITANKVDDIISTRQKQILNIDELVRSRFIEMFIENAALQHWPKTNIGAVATDARTGPFGSALHHDEFVDEGVFVLGIDNAVENRFSYNKMRYITDEKYQQLKRYTVKPGDVIITIMGTVGRSAVIPEDMPKAINTKHLACITPDKNQIDSYFLTCLFQMHPEIRSQLQNQSKGAIMDGLNLTIIKALKFSLPPLTLQKQFVDFFKKADKLKINIQISLEKLAVVKSALMQQYFG